MNWYQSKANIDPFVTQHAAPSVKTQTRLCPSFDWNLSPTSHFNLKSEFCDLPCYFSDLNLPPSSRLLTGIRGISLLSSRQVPGCPARAVCAAPLALPPAWHAVSLHPHGAAASRSCGRSQLRLHFPNPFSLKISHSRPPLHLPLPFCAESSLLTEIILFDCLISIFLHEDMNSVRP